MINLSTSAAAHAYAYRTSGSGMVLGSNAPNSRRMRTLRPFVESTTIADSALQTVDDLDKISQGYGSINGFRHNRFQYEIPTVGQHYGNAFHLAEDEEEVRDFIVERHHYGTEVHNLMEEHFVDDDDEEEDIEMSTAVEVISIDPNCDYDTEEEDDDMEEDVKYEHETENEEVQEYGNGEECDESQKETNQPPMSAVQNVARNVTLSVGVANAIGCSSEVNEMCSNNVADIHCQMKDELVEATDRSRSRSSSNIDSSSTSNSSRDSSTSSSSSSTYSHDNTFDNDKIKELAAVSSNRQDEEQDVAMHQYHQHSYHSEDGEDDTEEDDEEDDDQDLDFSPTKNTLWELPAKLLQDKSGSKKSKAQPHGRRKRCSSSQRQSFSMPHSPVGAGKIDSGGVIGGLLPTSLSFDDLDSLVCDLSPMKNLPMDKASTNGIEDDDLLVDPLVDAANFDLTAYITGDDTMSSENNSKRSGSGSKYQNNASTQRIVESVQLCNPVPKSRGKELKVLRQHMLPREHKYSSVEPNTFGDMELMSSGKQRGCAAKAVRKLTMDDDSSEADDEHTAIEQANNKSTDYRNEVRGVRRVTKRKVVDDTDKDPTWNPSGGISSKSKPETKLSNQKQPTTNCATSSVAEGMTVNVSISNATNKHSAGSSQCNNSVEREKVLSKPPAMVKKGTKFGQVIKTETSTTKVQGLGSSKKSHLNATPKSMSTEGRDHQVHTNVHRKKTNVKLDHDYCSPKRSTATGSNVPGALCATSGQQRKTIEIPFLLPTKEQLRQERKLQKEKKRSEQLLAMKKHLTQSDISSNSSDNVKDKRVQQYRSCNDNGSVSVASNAQKITTSLSGPLSNVEHSLPTFERKRTDVNKTCVNKAATGSIGSVSGSANDVSLSNVRVAEVKKGVLPNVAGGSVKRQISLLKINQPTAAVTIPVESHVSISTQVKIDGAISRRTTAALNEKTNHGCVETGKHNQEVVANRNASSTTVDEESNSKHEVVVRKKLNLQEYKKRREHPESVPEADQRATNGIHPQKMNEIRGNGSSVNCTNGYSNSKAPVLNDVVIPKPEQTTVKPDTISMQSSKSGVTATEPLDPISAAKMKALRMQQLKKEAAIKSNEVKLSQKTIPLMPILPLAQITSLEFDEHGNPLPLDEARARQRGEENGVQDALKMHPDYEEIIIVSIGCNTSLTITPTEKDTQTAADQVQASSDQQDRRQRRDNSKNAFGSEKEASRLLDISDTIKRCCPSVDTMPGSSLIASIQEAMIKKSNITTSIQGTLAVTTPAASQTVPVGAEASIAEGAVTLKVETTPNAGAAVNNAVGGGVARDQQYVLHQSSPYVGVSPPSSFSPGKPERAHTTNNTRPVTDSIVHSSCKQTRTSKPPVGGTQTHSFAGSIATQTDTNVTPVVEHGEDKIIMHLRKDRVRAQRIDAATQTESCGRFPPLHQLSPPRLSPIEQKQSGDNSQDSAAARQREQQKRIERRSYRLHPRRNGSESPSGADSDAADRPSSRAKSYQARQRTRDRQSHSHSRSRSRHRSSRRRSSCSSGSRSRSRSGYSRVHHSRHSQQQNSFNGTNNTNGCNNTNRHSRSRRKSRTCSRSSSSTSSSRYGSRGRRSLSSSSSTSSMSSSGTSDSGHGAVHSSRSRSRSPRSRSHSGMRSSTPDRRRYHSREHLNHRRTLSPERKIVYVGRLESTARKEDLQQKFQPYGKIVKITLHLKANGTRYGFVTFEKPQHAYDAIDACGTDPSLRSYDVSFGGRRAFCRTQYADLDGEVSNDRDHQMPYVTLDGSLLLPSRGPIPYSGPAVCNKEPTYGGGALTGGSMAESFDDLLKQFKKEIGARKT
ncbi:serine-rich adhesin for platelets [Anopheles marshallii]|uniref:serine-rich adhesin for platelets n=1 Tax=Anopheles marshallii TaxID=1521116 RepID=UPI00237AC952|nr:serine-rich adhesin for platelets [Anopheles marshallii]